MDTLHWERFEGGGYSFFIFVFYCLAMPGTEQMINI